MVKTYLVVLALLASFVVGFSEVRALQVEKERIALSEFCGSQPALTDYFQAIIQDGDTQNDWVTHLPVQCQSWALEFGVHVNDALDREEVPYTGLNDTH